MRVLCFRHVPFEGPGLLEPVLRERGIALDYADLYLNPPTAPDPAAYEGLVFLGGPMSVNDDLPWLRAEEEYLRAAVAAGRPVLGICLGSQLMAGALGAKVSRNPAKEIGWFEVRFTPEAANDPLFAGLSAETLFHWHGETFELPAGATLLASSALCRNQAFRVGERAWGLQFHAEITPEMIADWCGQDENEGDVRELAAPLDPYRNLERSAAVGRRVLEAWCGLLQRDSGRNACHTGNNQR
jgi:GMP synthase-like glutamine amidotransferase